MACCQRKMSRLREILAKHSHLLAFNCLSSADKLLIAFKYHESHDSPVYLFKLTCEVKFFQFWIMKQPPVKTFKGLQKWWFFAGSVTLFSAILSKLQLRMQASPSLYCQRRWLKKEKITLSSQESVLLECQLRARTRVLSLWNFPRSQVYLYKFHKFPNKNCSCKSQRVLNLSRWVQ